MRPVLERLESRDMMDAALAYSFSTQLVPVLLSQHGLIMQHVVNEVNYALAYAQQVATAMGPQWAAANLPPLLSATDALLAAIPQEQTAFMAALDSDAMLLLQFPASSKTQAVIDGTLQQLESLNLNLPI